MSHAEVTTRAKTGYFGMYEEVMWLKHKGHW